MVKNYVIVYAAKLGFLSYESFFYQRCREKSWTFTSRQQYTLKIVEIINLAYSTSAQQ
jgi:hypothetical protein